MENFLDQFLLSLNEALNTLGDIFVDLLFLPNTFIIFYYYNPTTEQGST